MSIVPASGFHPGMEQAAVKWPNLRASAISLPRKKKCASRFSNAIPFPGAFPTQAKGASSV